MLEDLWEALAAASELDPLPTFTPPPLTVPPLLSCSRLARVRTPYLASESRAEQNGEHALGWSSQPHMKMLRVRSVRPRGLERITGMPTGTEGQAIAAAPAFSEQGCEECPRDPQRGWRDLAHLRWPRREAGQLPRARCEGRGHHGRGRLLPCGRRHGVRHGTDPAGVLEVRGGRGAMPRMGALPSLPKRTEVETMTQSHT